MKCGRNHVRGEVGLKLLPLDRGVRGGSVADEIGSDEIRSDPDQRARGLEGYRSRRMSVWGAMIFGQHTPRVLCRGLRCNARCCSLTNETICGTRRGPVTWGCKGTSSEDARNLDVYRVKITGIKASEWNARD